MALRTVTILFVWEASRSQSRVSASSGAYLTDGSWLEIPWHSTSVVYRLLDIGFGNISGRYSLICIKYAHNWRWAPRGVRVGQTHRLWGCLQLLRGVLPFLEISHDTAETAPRLTNLFNCTMGVHSAVRMFGENVRRQFPCSAGLFVVTFFLYYTNLSSHYYTLSIISFAFIWPFPLPPVSQCSPSVRANNRRHSWSWGMHFFLVSFSFLPTVYFRYYDNPLVRKREGLVFKFFYT